MKNQKLANVLQIIIFFLVLLWAYTATSKLVDLNEFEQQLSKQNFSPTLSAILLWGIPLGELATAILLVFKRTRLIGFVCSSLLMILFTGYIGLVLIRFYKEVPCSCGGVLKYMGWKLHFWFNVFFLLLAVFGVWLEKRRLQVEKKMY